MEQPPFFSYANKVSALRETLGGGNETMISATSIVAADTTNASAFDRTTDQVLHIVLRSGSWRRYQRRLLSEWNERHH